MMPAKNKCPHPGCPNRKPYHIYACPRHWRTLPLDKQRAIKAAYFQHGALSPPWLVAHEDAMEFWRRVPASVTTAHPAQGEKR